MDLLEIRKKAKGLKGREAPEADAKAGKKKAKPPRPAAKTPDPSPAEAEGPARDAEVASPSAPVLEASARPAEAKAVRPAGTAAGAEAAAGQDAEAGREVEYLAFMLGPEEYAVRVEDVREIIRPQNMTAVPRAPEFIMGIISLRGVVLPVFDIKKRLGLDDTERTRATRIIVLAEGGSSSGILVDRVTGVVRLSGDTVEPPPAVIGGVEAEYLEGLGRHGDRLVILFNTGKIMQYEA